MRHGRRMVLPVPMGAHVGVDNTTTEKVVFVLSV